MTREEAIAFFKDMNECTYGNLEAVEMAIKALEQEPCEDAVSRQEVLDLVADYDLSMGQVVRGIHALPSVTPQDSRWIPVSEKLPKAGDYVGDVAKYYLVQNEYGDMLVARYTHSGYWEQIYQLKTYDDEIVAWMPLPEPHKAESEETETWNGIHTQITAPKGTFERIFNDADDDNDI